MNTNPPFDPRTHKVILEHLRMDRRDYWLTATNWDTKPPYSDFIEHCQQKIAKLEEILALLQSEEGHLLFDIATGKVQLRQKRESTENAGCGCILLAVLLGCLLAIGGAFITPWSLALIPVILVVGFIVSLIAAACQKTYNVIEDLDEAIYNPHLNIDWEIDTACQMINALNYEVAVAKQMRGEEVTQMTGRNSDHTFTVELEAIRGNDNPYIRNKWTAGTRYYKESPTSVSYPRIVEKEPPSPHP